MPHVRRADASSRNGGGVKYEAIHQRGEGATGAEPTPERSALLEKWAPVIFDTWRPHHELLALSAEGGVIIVAPYSATDAKCAWMPHARFVQLLRNAGRPAREPLDVPAHVRVPDPMTARGPRDIAWVLIELPGRPTRIAAIEWEQVIVAQA